jgi:hypothetical protein
VQTAKDTALLVKESDVLVIDYTATIQAAPGFTKASVVADIKTNIASFNATQKLGGQAFVGDIDKIVEATTGVLRIQGEPTKFSPTNQVGVLNSVQAANNQVLSINPNIF